MSFENETIIIELEEEGERLDKILAKRFQDNYSRTYFQSLIDQQLVLMNGEVVKKRAKPKADDEIEIQFVIAPEIDVVAEPIPLNIIFEDPDIIVVNKPAGMVVHPAPGHWKGTFVNALLYHCHSLPASESCRPGIVHRLDKDTSGLLVAAKTAEAQQKLSALFASRKVEKNYIAICAGNPGTRIVDKPIGRHPIHRKQMAIVPNGRTAKSSFETLFCDGSLSIVKISISTGRTHQIRVHLLDVNAPVLGDNLYGNQAMNRKYGVGRQMLHASQLKFQHPITHQEMAFSAPIPLDMQILVDKLSPNCLC